MKTFILYIMLLVISLLLPTHTYSQWTVTSLNDSKDAHAWDDPDTEEDEASDGKHRDYNNEKTLRSALEEIQNMQDVNGNTDGFTITINISGTIVLDDEIGEVYLPENCTLIPGKDKNVIIKGVIATGNNCTIKYLTVDVPAMKVGIGAADNVIIDSVLFKSTGGAFGIAVGSNCKVTHCVIGQPGSTYLAGIGVDGDNNLIENNKIQYYTHSGIDIPGGTTNQIIRKNAIGDNNSAPRMGIMLVAANSTVGGDIPSDGNVIIGNGQMGIQVGATKDVPADGNTIKNNFIGCNRDLSPAPNGNGIVVVSSNNTISSNIIVWNQQNGVLIQSIDSTEIGTPIGNKVFGNSIGGIEGKDTPMPNSWNGVCLQGAVEDNVIGSDLNTDYAPNFIVNNQGHGISTEIIAGIMPTKNTYIKNIIHTNAKLGIKNAENTQENVKPPKLDSLVKGKLYGSNAPSGSRIDIYETDKDESGSGEGKKWIKKFIVNNPSFYQIDIGTLPENGITATLTTTNGSTSEFSCNVPLHQSVTKQLEMTFFDKINLSDKNKHVITYLPDRMPTSVKYQVNNTPVKDANITGNTAWFEVEMGKDFMADIQNKIYFKSIGCNGFVDTLIFEPYVVHMRNYAGTVSDYRVQRNDPELRYIKNSLVEWPKPNVNASITIPAITPYIGGTWGLKETGLKFPLEVSSLGTTFDKTITVQGGIGLGDKQFDLTGDGTAHHTLKPSGLETTGDITANLPIKLYEKEQNLLTVIPGVSSFCDIPVAGEVCSYLTSLLNAGIRTSITLDLNGNANFKNEGDELFWQSGEIKSTLTASVVGSAGIGSIAGFFVEGRGSGTLTIPIPSWAPTASGSLTFRAYGQIAGVGSISGEQTWTIGSGIAKQNDDIPQFLTESLPIDSTSIMLSAKAPFDASASICNVNGSNYAVVWTEAATTPEASGRNIILGNFRNNKLENSLKVIDDGKNNRNPQIIALSASQVLVVWEQNDLPSGSLKDINVKQYLSAAKLKFAIVNVDNNIVSSRGDVDLPNKLDFSPKLLRQNDGTCRLLFQSTDGSTIAGNASTKASIYSAEFISDNFNQPKEITSESGLLQWSSAIAGEGKLYIVYEKDGDNDLLTADDREIYLFTLNSDVKETIKLTNNSISDMFPVISTNGSNQPQIAFANSDGIYYNLGGLPDQSTKISSNAPGMNFSHAKMINSSNGTSIIWSGARGFYSLTLDNNGKWSELLKTKEFDYSNMLNSISATNDDKVLAVFQKFNNKDKYVMLENNELSAGYLDFKSTTTSVIDNLTNSDRMMIYPNPATDLIEISVVSKREVSVQSEIKIFNIYGQIVSTPICSAATSTSGRLRIDVSGLSPGMYFVRFGDLVQKFVKL